MKKLLIALLVLVVAGAGGWALFERHERGELTKKSKQACEGRDRAEPGAAMPLGLPLTSGATVLSVTSQGKTTIAFAKIAGDPGDIVSVRDRVLTDLKGAGYTVKGTDQEPGFEAEAELQGTHAGTLKVSPLCTGLLELRYKIEQ